MNDKFDRKSNYNDILNRIQKKFSTYEGLLILKKQYLTNNVFYYFLTLIIRFIHILLFCGDYYSINKTIRKYTSFKQYLKYLTIYNFVKQFDMSYKIYFIIVLIILVLLLIRLFLLYQIFKKLKNRNPNDNNIMINRYQIIIEHIIFLFFPYIIEYLSFIYYMFFFPSQFIIKSNDINKIVLSLFILINTILIIEYNIENYILMVCSNKVFTTTIFEANSSLKENNNRKKKSISYKYSKKAIFIFIFIQNILLFLNIENYLNNDNNNNNKKIFKFLISILLFLSIIALFLCKINKFDYTNFINSSFSIILFYCYYTIIIDLIIYLGGYSLSSKINEIIYIFIKLFLSYILYLLFIMKTNSYLENSITEILFQEKKNIKENLFSNSFYYLHEIMLKINEQKKVESVFSLVKFLGRHINSCKKLDCNCKLFETFIKTEDKEKLNEKESENYISELLIILNYLFESAFIDYDIYNNLDLIILLSEHFCHLKNNPIFSFSFINTFNVKHINKLNKLQLIDIYELSQKYIYYISAKEINDIETNILKKNIQILFNNQKTNEFKSYYVNINISYNLKKLINNYIDNEIKILKYKFLFEDSLSFQFDENNENIISVKVNFYNQTAKIENESNNKKDKKSQKLINENTNLYNVIHLLEKEQLYYNQIIKSINDIDNTRVVPIFIIFKLFLFLDLFKGGKIPNEIGNKIHFSLKKNTNLYNGIINNHDYYILKNRYKEENYKKDSKIYLIFEFKKEIRTKYFTEDAALKLGYKQKDLINEKIDILFPKAFYKSHLNSIKQITIGNQTRYLSKKSYFFDKNNTVIYSANFEISLLYNLSKYLIILIESIFNFENEYTFMLDNNFDILTNSKNFEDEYYLNQRLLKTYNIGLLEILKIKSEKLYKIFEKEFIKINFQKLIKNVKTEEFFIPQFYNLSEEKNARIVNSNYFNNSKNNILSKIYASNFKEEKNEYINNKEDEDDEERKFIKRDNIKKSLSELFINPREVIFHKVYTKKLNKGIFIENIAKELTKIPDNDLMFENDKSSYNLIISAKKLISKLLTKKELTNEIITITIRFSFYYDKPFYFFIIDDEKKSFLNISKSIHFENNQKKKYTIPIPYNKNQKSRNKNLANSQIPVKKNSLKNKDKKNVSNKKEQYMNNNNYLLNKSKSKLLEIIDEKRKTINKDKFISTIKWILSVIIVCILIIYFIIIFFQKNIINMSKKLLLSYYYITHSKDAIMYSHSKLLQIYYDYSGMTNNKIISTSDYENILISLCDSLKLNYYNFYFNFFEYNSLINHDFNLIYNKRNFSKLRGFWQEVNYESTFSGEMELVIYNMFSINISDRNSKGIKTDINNFIFFRNREDSQERINTSFIKLIYYFCANYEFVYKDIFQEIEDGIYLLYKTYIKSLMNIYILLEILGLIFFINFFIANSYYLYFSNGIIIKNIIFLFLDFNEDKNKGKNNNSFNMINLKLMEFKKVIDDFDLVRFEIYSKNIDNINKNKTIYQSDNLKNDIGNNNGNFNDKKDNNYEILNQTGKSSISIKANNENNQKNYIKNKDKNNILKQTTDSNSSINKILNYNRKGTNNSSHNYLVESNSQFFKEKLNNNSINASNELLTNNINNSSSLYYSKKNIKGNQLPKDENEEDKEKIEDIILNKSNKPIILLIKVYSIVMVILFLIISAFSIYKVIFTIKFNNKFDSFFSDFTIITNRYSIVYYYFNTIRTLLIFPEGEKKKQLKEIMENMNQYYVDQNNKFLNVLSSNMGTYKEIIKLFNLLTESRNNSTQIIKDNICSNFTPCLNYLDSKQSIFGSGVDLGYKTSITDMNNIYLDYKNIKDQKDIKLINSTIINSPTSEFILIGLSLSNMIYYVQEKIFDSFKIDVVNFNKSYENNTNILNIISIFFSIFNFLFVIICIFLTINNYSEPIKESSFRINCSFNFIKIYNLNNLIKNDNTLA